MKNYIYILVGQVLTILLLASCGKYLDRELSTDLTFEEVTTSYSYSKSRLAAIYSQLQPGFLSVDGAMMASACDEAEHTLETSEVQKFNNGSWNAYSNPGSVWAEMYKGIRMVNQYLVTCDSINLDKYKYDPSQQAVYTARLEEINRWKCEARFLRAFFYFELIKRYGGVPLILQAGTIGEDYSNIARNSLEKCIIFIKDECDAVAAVLPLTYAASDLGRVTKGAALALKSRLLLYAASDLFNTSGWASGYASPDLISLTGDRQARWQAAANAAKAVIDLEGSGYALGSNYSALFGASNYNSSEVVFCRRDGATNTFEMANYSVGYDRGQSGTTPSQNLVDAYDMKTTGKPITDASSGYDATNPYVNRDPRMKMTILFNNSTWKSRPIECWAGGRDGMGVTNATRTGYYLKKYVDESINLVTGTSSVHTWIYFRLAEMYLNYAEALNEASPENSDVKLYIDKIRQRAGVEMPPLPSGLTQSQMRERIRNERRVEFAFEDHRFWDVRRWMIAPSVLGTPLRGMQINKNAEGTFSYTPVTVEQRIFSPQMYFYPIPQNEIYISNSLVQNPLW